MSIKQILLQLAKSVKPSIKWELSTKTSVKGLFGTGCFVSWSLAAHEYCKKERSNRKIITCIVTGALFGATYLFLDQEQKEHDLKMAKVKHPSANSGSTEVSKAEQVQPNQTIPPQPFVFGQNKGHEDYDKRQLIGRIIGIEDICILYCETGVGKSVLSFQMATDIANGVPSAIQPNDDGVHIPQRVVLYDSEMTDRDYDRRYPGYVQPTNLTILGSYYDHEQEWLDDVEMRIFEREIDATIILDNITSAFKSMTAENIRRFIKVSLRQLQEKASAKGFHITFIIVAHTTKEGILGGSMNFQNFATSIIHLMPGPDDAHNILAIDKCRNYGDMKGKRLLLRRSEAVMKHFELECELEAEPEQAAAPSPVKPVVAAVPQKPKYPRLTQSQIDEMRARIKAGEPKKSVAKAYGIPESYINRYLNGTMESVPDNDNTADNTSETDDNNA